MQSRSPEGYLHPMIIYNVTINIDYDVHDEWVDWMKQVHIPEVMATGRFIENKMSRVLGEEEGGVTYAIQYLAPDMEAYHRYVHEDAPKLQEEHSQKYKDKFVAFRTILEVVHHTDGKS